MLALGIHISTRQRTRRPPSADGGCSVFLRFLSPLHTICIGTRERQGRGKGSVHIISARPEGGSWGTLGTVPLALDSETENGRWNYGDIGMSVVPPPPLPSVTVAFYCGRRPSGWMVDQPLMLSLPGTGSRAPPAIGVSVGLDAYHERGTRMPPAKPYDAGLTYGASSV